MLEVPSLLFQLDELLARVDFLSVGSNDLMQFLYAADRGNTRVSDRFDPLSAPVLRALKDIADKARKHGKPVTLCGELASQPIGALALVDPRLSLAVAVALGGRPGQGDAARSRLPQRRAARSCRCSEQPVGSVSIRDKLEAFAAAEGLQLVTTLPQQKLDALLARHALVESELAHQSRAATPTSSCRANSPSSMPVIEPIKAYRAVAAEIADLDALIADADDRRRDARAWRDAEKPALQARSDRLDEQLRLALIPKDAMDDHNVILEIRAGTGGDEASLFAGDLFRMYERYAAHAGLEDRNPVDQRRHQRRLQGNRRRDPRPRRRSPSSSSNPACTACSACPTPRRSGRIHTSAATVAVLPEVEDVDIEIKDDDLKIDTMRAQGAGGQHVNKTESAIRITHMPSGIVVFVQEERSQHKNTRQGDDDAARQALRRRAQQARRRARRRAARPDRLRRPLRAHPHL